MRVLLRSNDVVLVSFAMALLRDAGIQAHVFDSAVSTVEGSLGIFPRRIMVPYGDWQPACTVLRDADLGTELVLDGDGADHA